jgi:meiosis-specific transcription factor NDT80
VDSSALESAFPGIRASLNLPHGHQAFALHYDPDQSPKLSLPQTSYILPPIHPGQMPLSTLPPQIGPIETHTQSPPFSQQELICHITYRSQPLTAVVDANILRGFFLSSDEVWTTYRRAYFEVEASFTFEQLPVEPCAVSDFSIAHELGEKSISGFALSLGAKEAGEKAIGLIRHTSKKAQVSVAQCAVVPKRLSTSNTTDKATWDRLQFRLPTRNNGKRRPSQQYFHLVIQLLAKIDDNEEKATWVCITESRSVPLVVRGRTPSHYQTPTI